MNNKVEVYTMEEIHNVISILETVQDGLISYLDGDESWDMLQEAINILAQTEVEE